MAELDLMRIVTEFREGLLQGRSSEGACFTVCAPLDGLLSFYGVRVRLVELDFSWGNHFILEQPDGTIIDPTADQFTDIEGNPMPAVYIGPMPETYKAWTVSMAFEPVEGWWNDPEPAMIPGEFCNILSVRPITVERVEPAQICNKSKRIYRKKGKEVLPDLGLARRI